MQRLWKLVVDGDGESLNNENLEDISDEPLNQEIAEAELDELKNVEYFLSFKKVDDLRHFRISCIWIL